METKFSKQSRQLFLTGLGVFINVVFSFIMYKLGLPLFFDTVGTIFVAAITGFMFPAICTAVASNIICSFFYEPSIYLAIFNAIVAVITIFFIRNNTYKKAERVIAFSAITALISTLSSTLVQSRLYGDSFPTLIISSAQNFSAATSIPYFLSLFFITYILYFLEKIFICILVLILFAVVPKKFLNYFNYKSLMSNIAYKATREHASKNPLKSKHPLHKKIVLTFVLTSLVLVVVTSYIALRVYFDNTKKEKQKSTWSCAQLLAESIDPSQVEDFIKYRTAAQGYLETYDLILKLEECSNNISRLYVQRFEDEGSIYIFDTNEKTYYQPGEIVPYSRNFAHLASSLTDNSSPQFYEQKGLLVWQYTYFYPVIDNEGRCLCYACADVYIDYFREYMGSFIMRVLLIMAGFFIVIISHTIWTFGNAVSYPISAIAECVDSFADTDENQQKLEESLKTIRSLDIHSGDEIQKLYDAICRMTVSQTEQINDIKRLSDSTAKMQDGLIITMADMVENRDSDTGEHIQKTAAYVKIITEGLKKKGYYAQKLTPKFISDAVRSAPLHDVGKINIPDNVLNKPGKLTDEEYAIMKTHTTAGKTILEKAISTVQGENYLKEARNMAAYHHERWDGKGYPEGLHGEVIPLSARIMAVADVFDALASPRVYKPAFPFEKAIEILKEGSGTQFDPKCVEVFLDSLSEVKAVLKKYTGGNFAL